MENRLGGVLVLAAVAMFVACGGKSTGPNESGKTDGAMGASQLEVPKVDPTLCSTKGKTVQTFDLNQDNRPDVWKLYAQVDKDGTRVNVLTCKQVDYDHDGGMDYVATYQESGELIAEEFDFTFDGKFDAREHYDRKGGKVSVVERDTDHNKKPDLWEKYDTQGRLESIERDRNADGKPDVWEQYGNDQLLTILYDEDYDSRVDRREDAQAPKSITPAPELERDEQPVDEQKEVPAPDAKKAGDAAKKPAEPKKAPATKK